MDFIHLIRTDPEMADEFCYLNKISNPYDFKIVEFDERNPREYMTISARVNPFILFIQGNNSFHR
jgi:dynein heavy chain